VSWFTLIILFKHNLLKLKRRQHQKMISMEKLLKLARGSKNCNNVVYLILTYYEVIIILPSLLFYACDA